MMFMDEAFAQMLDDRDIEAIYMREKPTLDEAKEIRKMHFASELIQQNIADKNEGENGKRDNKVQDDFAYPQLMMRRSGSH